MENELALPSGPLYEPPVLCNVILGGLAFLSLVLLLWQWLAARRFPLHRRATQPGAMPGVTLLKPLKGCDSATKDCLRSWFLQDYPGPVQILFGVASAEDPVCDLVRELLTEFPGADARLAVCGPLHGANLKVCKLAELERSAKYEIVVISDADVRVPPDLLVNACAPLESAEVGLVNCFYRLANPTTLAMHWEAVAINVDFWSQVLQSRSLKPLDFALGAVMVTRRAQLRDLGGFEALADCLADDYQLGHRMARQGRRIELCPVVVECWSAPMGWNEVWKHQLRWARTIRVCQPAPYFLSILSNPTLWPWLWLAVAPGLLPLGLAVLCLGTRMATALDLETRLNPQAHRGEVAACLAPLKDLLQTALWLFAFLGNRVEWRGVKMKIRPDGTLAKPQP